MPRICLDPGHNTSGSDTGAQGNGLREQDLNLDISQRLRTLLLADGFEIVMTRDGDFVNGPHASVQESLKTRCDIANQFGADLLVSIHVNAGGGTGSEVYALPGGRAVVAAQRVLDRLVYACGWANRGVKTDRELYVLVHTDMPAILTENGFIDSSDAEKLAVPNFRQIIAEAHAKGICDFFGVSYSSPVPSKPIQSPSQEPPLIPEQPIQPTPVQSQPTSTGTELPAIIPLPSNQPMENSSKKWYDSKTVWVNGVMLAGVVVQSVTGQNVITPEIQAAIITIINLILRSVTKDKITIN